MKPKKFLFIALVLSFLSSSLCLANSVQTKDQPSPQKQLESMSLKEKVGQLFAFSFSGKKDNRYVRRLIKDFKPGSLISFRRNISTPYQTRKFNRDLQRHSLKHSKQPLLLMLDQEGGRVTRIKTRYKTPSALSIGETKDPNISFTAGKLTGELVSLVGFNMNLAPVVDLSDPNKKNFIGNRSFGDNPNLVFNMGQEFSKGLWSHKILPTYKHFPGHGGIIQDSHKKTPVKYSSLAELEKTDLVPFLKTQGQGFPSAIMVAHVAFPNIDPTGLPASYSHKLVTEILKEKYKYQGLIVTDDLEMSGASGVGNVAERVKVSFLAGCDILMVTGGYKKQKQAFYGIYNAVKKGLISEERLDESVLKIITQKSKMSLAPKAHKKHALNKAIKKVQHGLKRISDKVVKTHIYKSLDGQKQLKSSIKDNEQFLLFSAYRSVYYNLKRAIKNKISFIPMSQKRKLNITQKLKANPSKVALFYASGLGSLRKLTAVPKKLKKNMIIINTTHPGSVLGRADYKAVIDINTLHSNSGEWLAKQIVARKQKRTPASPL